jgi:hypothetical protein
MIQPRTKGAAADTLLADDRHGAAASFTAARSIQVKACQSLKLLDVFKAVRVITCT